MTGIWRLAKRDPYDWAYAGVVSAAIAVVSAFGLCACCVGFLFTLIYQLAVQAGAAAMIDRSV